jgi:hypothetical protein
MPERGILRQARGPARCQGCRSWLIGGPAGGMLAAAARRRRSHAEGVRCIHTSSQAARYSCCCCSPPPLRRARCTCWRPRLQPKPSCMAGTRSMSCASTGRSIMPNRDWKSSATGMWCSTWTRSSTAPPMSSSHRPQHPSRYVLHWMVKSIPDEGASGGMIPFSVAQ